MRHALQKCHHSGSQWTQLFGGKHHGYHDCGHPHRRRVIGHGRRSGCGKRAQCDRTLLGRVGDKGIVMRRVDRCGVSANRRTGARVCVSLGVQKGILRKWPGIRRGRLGIQRAHLVPSGTIDHLPTVRWYAKPKCDRFYRLRRRGRVLLNPTQQ
jgi:hypothetical protein